MLVGLYFAGFTFLGVVAHMLMPIYGRPHYKWFFSDWPFLIVYTVPVLVVFVAPALVLWKQSRITIHSKRSIALLIGYVLCFWIAIKPLGAVVEMGFR